MKIARLKFPNCIHTCCRLCIIQHCKAHKRDHNRTDNVPCPLCRSQFDIADFSASDGVTVEDDIPTVDEQNPV